MFWNESTLTFLKILLYYSLDVAPVSSKVYRVENKSHWSLSKKDGQPCTTPTGNATNTITKPRRQPCVETTCPAMWAKHPKEWDTCLSLQHAQNTRSESLTESQLFFSLSFFSLLEWKCLLCTQNVVVSSKYMTCFIVHPYMTGKFSQRWDENFHLGTGFQNIWVISNIMFALCERHEPSTHTVDYIPKRANIEILDCKG